eukprot:2659577-Prymnesium_polylepis.2
MVTPPFSSRALWSFESVSPSERAKRPVTFSRPPAASPAAWRSSSHLIVRAPVPTGRPASSSTRFKMPRSHGLTQITSGSRLTLYLYPRRPSISGPLSRWKVIVLYPLPAGTTNASTAARGGCSKRNAPPDQLSSSLTA